MAEERPHRGWVNFLTILIGVITVVAILATWVDRQVFDTNQWGDTSLEMLQNPKIQSAVADYAVSELYANVDVDKELKTVLPGDTKDLSGVAAGALRQVADQGAQRALGNQQVQNLWRAANIKTHATLVAVLEDDSNVLSTSGGQVRLELQPLIIEIADQVGLGDQARANIPASVGQIEIVDSKELSTAQTATSLIHGTALIASLLVLVLIALAIYLSTGYRWLTLLWIAVALIAAAILILILRSVIGGVVVPQLADIDIQPAARAAYDIGTELLKSIAWTIIWSSVLLLAVAWLISPNGAAASTRKFMAVPVGRYPAAVYSLFGLVALIFLLMGTGDQRGFLVRLAIVAMALAGTYFFRRQVMLENPDADFTGVNEFFERSRDKVKGAWDNRPKDISKNLPSFGGDKGEEAVGVVEPETAAPKAAEPEAAVPKAVEPETAVLPAVDPESTRLERLERLAALHQSGALTDEEFAEEKARLRADG